MKKSLKKFFRMGLAGIGVILVLAIVFMAISFGLLVAVSIGIMYALNNFNLYHSSNVISDGFWLGVLVYGAAWILSIFLHAIPKRK